MKWPFRKQAAEPKPAGKPRTISWELYATDTPRRRAEVLAQVAFGNFYNREGLAEQAAWRIQDVLEKYDQLDRGFLPVEPLLGQTDAQPSSSTGEEQ